MQKDNRGTDGRIKGELTMAKEVQMEQWMKNLTSIITLLGVFGAGFMTVINRNEALASEINDVKTARLVADVRTEKDIEILKSDMSEVKGQISDINVRVNGLENTIGSMDSKLDLLIESNKSVNHFERRMEELERMN